MEEPRFIYESDKVLYALMSQYIVAESNEDKNSALKGIANGILKLIREGADVSSLFINTNGSMIRDNVKVKEEDFKLTSFKTPNGGNVIPLFLVSDRLTDITYPSVVRATELEKVVREVVSRNDITGIVINPFGRPNMVYPKFMLKVVVDALDGKL